MNKTIVAVSVFSLSLGTFSGLLAQANLIKKVNAQQEVAKTPGFQFTELKNLAITPVEDQGNSGTCWSYSTNSFLESEINTGEKRDENTRKKEANSSF